MARNYSLLGPPLRPSAEDISFLEETVAAHARSRPAGAMRALLLGVTPDIALMRWPPGAFLLAADSARPMVEAVWPGDAPSVRSACAADWRRLPLPDSSLDIAVGDGSLNCVRYPEDCRALARALHGALKPGGILILRCYALPETPEPPERVFADALAGRFPSFTHFKFRLLMAMQRSPREGVAVNEVYGFWARQPDAAARFASLTGWPRCEIDAIELYRGACTIHTFPSLADARALLSEFFAETAISFPSGFDGERCPRLVLTPR